MRVAEGAARLDQGMILPAAKEASLRDMEPQAGAEHRHSVAGSEARP
jgi:hypothetical protein